MSVTLNGTSGLTFNDGSTQNTGATGFGFKNRIINGAMVIDQRNAGASVTATDGSYSLDRWKIVTTQNSKYTVQQNAGSVTPPVGFSNYLGVTSSSSYSVLSTDYLTISQNIEGFNFADMAWGTANAKSVTLSFWVYSSLTGTFGGSVANSSTARSYVFSYSIPVANTWTQISVTIVGDTTGTWIGATNGIGLRVYWSLGAGSSASTTAGSWNNGFYASATGATSVVGTSGATFYITGVQLEKGSTATSFDYRPYGTELALCQRYLPAWNSTASNSIICSGAGYSTVAGSFIFPFKVSTRVPPTGISTTSASSFSVVNSSGSYVASSGQILWGGSSSTESAVFNITGVSGLVAGGGTWVVGGSTAQIVFTGCEL